MENKIILGIGALVAAAGYTLYKIFFSGSNHPESGEENVSFVDTIDYERLYAWLKNEYKDPGNEIKKGCKFGIMPSSIAKKTFKEQYGHDILTNGYNDVIGTFVIDEQEEETLATCYFVFNNMAQSLKDMLQKDKIYIQELK